MLRIVDVVMIADSHGADPAADSLRDTHSRHNLIEMISGRASRKVAPRPREMIRALDSDRHIARENVAREGKTESARVAKRLRKHTGRCARRARPKRIVDEILHTV